MSRCIHEGRVGQGGENALDVDAACVGPLPSLSEGGSCGVSRSGCGPGHRLRGHIHTTCTACRVYTYMPSFSHVSRFLSFLSYPVRCLSDRPLSRRRSAGETRRGGRTGARWGFREGNAGGVAEPSKAIEGGGGLSHTHTHTHTAMTAERKGLVEFVRYARSCYDACRKTPRRRRVLDVVIGNTGGDMDSVVSALGYSYLSYLGGAGTAGAAAAAAAGQPVVLPVLSFARADLPLRRDVEHSLHALGLRPADLIFADELAADDDAAAGDQYRVRLVDHNVADNALVRAALGQQRAAVVAVVDHHADAGLYAAAAPRVVRPCGSCSSLVFLHFADAFARRYSAAGEDAQVRRRELEFLVTALAIDTDCLQHRVEAPDREVFETLFAPLLDTATLTAVGSTAKAEKLNIDGLSVYDLLRKDYKEYEAGGGARIGISSVACSLARLERLHGAGAVADAVAAWTHRQNLQLCVVMTSFVENGEHDDKGGVFRREIALAPPGFVPERALSCLKRELDLVAGGSVDAEFAKMAVFGQQAVGKSRKAVAPLLVGLLQ